MRLSLARLAASIALILGAVLFLLAGLGLWLFALYLYCLRYLAQDGAALTTGAVTFLGAGVITWIAIKLNR